VSSRSPGWRFEARLTSDSAVTFPTTREVSATKSFYERYTGLLRPRCGLDADLRRGLLLSVCMLTLQTVLRGVEIGLDRWVRGIASSIMKKHLNVSARRIFRRPESHAFI